MIFRDLLKIEDGIGDKVATFCYFMGSFVAGLVVAFVWGWELALICLISLPVSMIGLLFIGWVSF